MKQSITTESFEKALLALKSTIYAGTFMGIADVLFYLRNEHVFLTGIYILFFDLYVSWALGFISFSVIILSNYTDFVKKNKLQTFIYTVFIVSSISPVVFHVFTGHGVSKFEWAKYAPVIIVIAMLFVVYFLLYLYNKALNEKILIKYLFATLLFILSILIVVIDRNVMPGLYMYLHVTIVFVFIALLSFSISFFIKATKYSVVYMCLGLTTFYFAILFPVNYKQRVYISEHQSFVGRFVLFRDYLLNFTESMIFADDSYDSQKKTDISIFSADVGVAGHGIKNKISVNNTAVHNFLNYGDDLKENTEILKQATKYPTVILLIDALRKDRAENKKFTYFSRFMSESIVFSNMISPASSTSLVLPAISVGHPLIGVNEKGVFRILQKNGITSCIIAPESVLRVLNEHEKNSYRFCDGFTNIFTIATKHDKTQWGGGITTLTGEQITDKALQIIQGKDCPGVLWVHYFDVHQWSQITSFSGNNNERYDQAVYYMDKQLEKWYKIRDSINLIILADHGEMIDRENHKLHTKYLFPELVRVPFWVRIPTIPPKKVENYTALVDFAPTLLELTGLANHIQSWENRSLLRLVNNKNTKMRIIPMFESRQVSLIEDGWRYILNRRNAEWLYHISEDKEETNNIYEKYPKKAKKMQQRIYDLRAYFYNLSLSGKTSMLLNK